MRPAFQASLMITPLDILPVLCFLIIQGIYLESFLPPANEVAGRLCFQSCLSVILLGGSYVITTP